MGCLFFIVGCGTRSSPMVPARDELKADGLVLTTEINRRDARHTKQRAQLMSDLDDRRCAQSACGMACLRHGHVTYTLCDSCVW